MKKRLPLILVALAVVLLLALRFAVWAANTPVEQFDLELGRTYWFDLSESGIPGTVNDKLPDQTLHYVPFTYAGTVSAYTLLQAAIPTESEMEYEHSLFISEYNITHTVSWNELNKKDLIFRNLTEYNGVPYYIHAPSGGARYDTCPSTTSGSAYSKRIPGLSKTVMTWSRQTASSAHRTHGARIRIRMLPGSSASYVQEAAPVSIRTLRTERPG